ncbi:MAG TPA: vitamin B12 dependent-methionine synthase activation domain-containing protein, partial [Longimicrobiaceae bacterium]|nr:vitamin B12 dependent-methionine synthase activation domain-containing protein [Longimicrobiaceae bacterium]
STEAGVVETALKQSPGRSVVNSINLENGRERVDAVLPLVRDHGAAVIALTIDRDLGGMAKDADTKLAVARKIFDIATGEFGLAPDALIFDALTFTLATGDEEYRRSAVETIEGIRKIKTELPGVLTTLGVSNVSFGLQKHARAVLNSVFLYHCVEAGLDTAIINPAHVRPYFEIPEEERKLADDLIFDRREGGRDPLAAFIAHYEAHQVEEESAADPTEGMEPEEALQWKILHRKKDGVEELIDAAVERNGAVPVLNEVLLPAMKEVGDKFGAGELILPFVLQSAEVMKKAVARLENYLEKAEGQTKGKVVIATVYGDVHDIGKNLVNTILTNNGYTVFDLGKQVPVNTILEKAEEVGADAIGLSALLVSTSKQMPLCAQELTRRGLKYPLLVGGAAINPSFVRSAAMVGEGQVYPEGMFYCKDAFEGLAVMDRLQDAAGRESFVREHNEEMLERQRKYEANLAKAKSMRPASMLNSSVPEADVPAPPFWGVKTIDIPVDEVVACIDLNTLYRMQWGAKNLKGEEWERVLRDDFEPRLKRYTLEARTQGWLRPRAVYGYFPAGRDGDSVVVFDPAEQTREIGRFDFPRQEDREQLCLADYFRPLQDGKPADVVALQVVTSGHSAQEFVKQRNAGGDYSEGYFLHGFSVQTAEGTAEYLNRRIKQELGFTNGRGLRYSWGYPACPDIEQHEVLFRILPVEETLGVKLTSAFQLDPEQSTAAIVVHHPAAKYFVAG